MNVRAITAAALLTALVALLLGVWFVSAWRDVRVRTAEISRAPYVDADRRASELARDLRAELEGLLLRETRRPYFHYQNLMHDPQTTAGINVSRSPLANGPEETLVLGYFQLDAKGRATTPTLNDESPELSASERLADHRAFRDQVARNLANPLSPWGRPARPKATASAPPPADPPKPTTPPDVVTRSGQIERSQIIQLDPKVYAQNQSPNTIYSQQMTNTPVAPPAAPPGPVTITISPLEWRTMSFAGAPALIAIRNVDTPDSSFTQGLVVDRQALTNWLAARAGDTIPTLRPDKSTGVAVAPDWGLTVEPNPERLSKAAEDADALARTFVMRFAGVGGASVLAAALVVLLVTRSEKLARERSQFAAAAAHELRTPLTGLQLYGDMLADDLGDPGKMRDYARRMSDDAARLGRVVANILGFSQLERGNLTLDAQPGPLGEVLHDLAAHARPALERLGATLEVEVPRELRARFDRDALARIVGNLLDNAEKYTRHAPDRTIQLAAIDRGDVVEVSVADRGPGIADGAKLFRAFTRGSDGGDAPAGLGLGLTLSRSLARAMGGDLAYHARDGGGATFVLQLPAHRS
jgi:signal transduction histidine kinase